MSDPIPSSAFKSSRRRRAMIGSFVAIFLGALLLPLGGYVYVAVSDARAAEPSAPPPASDQQSNPRANYWRAVRQGYEGYTAASGPYTTNVLIQNGGQNWRQVRNGPIEGLGTWVLAIIVGVILLFAIIRGRIKLRHPPSGRTVERWSLGERVLHWYTAVLFIILALTGLSLLFGRALLIPAFGYDGFSAYASVAIAAHNYLGPFFIIGVVLEIIAWVRYALPNPKVDWEWIRSGGGFFGGDHPHSGHINPGEKYITFWTGLVLFGGAISVTGLILDFPIFGQVRETMQTANVVHDIAAVFWIALMLGHSYLGVWGVEGALSGMTSGRTSVEFATEHHDLWYESVGRKTEQAGAKPTRDSPHAV